MADAQTTIYGVNLPPKLTALRGRLVSALTADGSQATAANSAIFFALVTELSSVSAWMVSGELDDYDVSGRANPVDAYAVLEPYEPYFVGAIAELQRYGVDPAMLELLRDHFDSRAPLHSVAAVCIAVLFGVQVAGTT